MMELLRALLAEQGLFDSPSGACADVHVAIEGRDEVSVRYDRAEPAGSSSCLNRAIRRTDALLRVCSALGQRGYALTLFMSPRTVALYVRAGDAATGHAAPVHELAPRHS
jgi:hypothetical protein